MTAIHWVIIAQLLNIVSMLILLTTDVSRIFPAALIVMSAAVLAVAGRRLWRERRVETDAT